MPVIQISSINIYMYIYKIINKLNGKWYIGKHNGSNPAYMGSGKLLKRAYKKYGTDQFEKVIIETCITELELNLREEYWIKTTNATSDPMSYNLVEGGTGGDRSKFIPYDVIDYSKYKMQGTQQWFQSLTEDQKKDWHAKQSISRSKGWYVSTIDDQTETYVQNISKWCEEHNVDKSMPTALNKVDGRLFQKQTKGWRIRRSDMPPLSPYVNRQYESTNNKCKGRSWELVDGKRVWVDK